MADNHGLVRAGLGVVRRNRRYIVWFWLLNFALAWLGTSALRESAHTIFDHSLYADGLVHGFDLGVLIEFLMRPDSGPLVEAGTPAASFAFVFLAATALFLPGVFAGYASTYRLPREDFFRACGRNLWRFIRLMIVAAIVIILVAGILFGIREAIVKKAGESTNELLPFEVRMTGLALIFLVLTIVRIWFDLAEVDVVLNDQRAVRKSIRAGFRHMLQGLWSLLASYVAITIVAALILICGLWCWLRLVPSTSVLRALLISQATLFLLLVPRFWQRAVAVTYWQRKMLVPVATVAPAFTARLEASPPAGSPVPSDAGSEKIEDFSI